MTRRKQEFYEGSALHRLVRGAEGLTISYRAPYFLIDGATLVLLKYSTQSRSPWSFTFAPDEQLQLATHPGTERIVIGLICGSDGIAAIDYVSFQGIAKPREVALRIACFRAHGTHYEVRGPDGVLERKVPPSNWLRLIKR